ncbi:hypothetical protein [Bacillus sp. B3-WWTP-C-10-D-3]|uniref:hypothetical protein n=1 Tax=Bacillus sp. B3-WWTP-C-10-D-3 TaxID=2653217 RepID=UPI0012625CF9|nr:hypothetical protein [Bacillus sp. B3-WWTP-C-10-D-3]KAB7640293.1 hypothetical protein GBN83_09315 [Bacillus sp. B3-WWTP-C-10-D-3]
MTSFERKYVSEEDQLRMLQEVEKVLIERGYEYEYRDRLFFAEDMYDKVDWVIQKSIVVNPSLLEPDAENGMLYMIQIFDKDGYHFIPNIIMENDEDVQTNIKYKSWTPPTVESVFEFIDGYNERFPELEEEVRDEHTTIQI